MGNSTAYILIIIGILLLAYNLGYLNFGLLTQSLSVPIVFIIVGLVELITRTIKMDELGHVLRTIAGFLLVITIIVNIPSFFSKFFIVSAIPITEEPQFSANGSEYTCSFCEITGTVFSNKIQLNHDGELYTINTSVHNYSANTVFSSANYNFEGLTISNGIISIDNAFGETNILNANAFNIISSRNVFGETAIHTGPITGLMTITLDNTFGNTDLYIDPEASYWIDTSAVFGMANNYVGLKSSDYETAENKVRIIGNSVFGSINIYKE